MLFLLEQFQVLFATTIVALLFVGSTVIINDLCIFGLVSHANWWFLWGLSSGYHLLLQVFRQYRCSVRLGRGCGWWHHLSMSLLGILARICHENRQKPLTNQHKLAEFHHLYKLSIDFFYNLMHPRTLISPLLKIYPGALKSRIIFQPWFLYLVLVLIGLHCITKALKSASICLNPERNLVAGKGSWPP